MKLWLWFTWWRKGRLVRAGPGYPDTPLAPQCENDVHYRRRALREMG